MPLAVTSQALLGVDGPSPALLAAWKERVPPPGSKNARKAGRKATAAGGQA